MLWSLFLTLLYLTDGEAHKGDCVFHSYEGGPGQVIATFEPTLPGNISLTYGGKVLDIVGAIVSGAPFIGGALGALFDTIGALTDNTIEDMNTFQKALNELSISINKTIKDLKHYMDAKLDEHDYHLKLDTLKGLYQSSGLCASFSNPHNQDFCLRSLLLDIFNKYPTFLPADPKYQTFEQLLPLARQFADLHFGVLTDLINITNMDQDFLNALKNSSVVTYNYFVLAISKIIDQHEKAVHEDFSYSHLDFRQTACYLDICRCFASNAIEFSQQWDNDDGCTMQEPDPKCNGCIHCGNILYKIWLPSETKYEIARRRRSYITDLVSNIKKYWDIEVGRAMITWKKMGMKVGAEDSSYLPYDPDSKGLSVHERDGGHLQLYFSLLQEQLKFAQATAKYALMKQEVRAAQENKEEL